MLERTGLAASSTRVIVSAERGRGEARPGDLRPGARPRSAPTAGDALHVGDDLAADVGGARAAGIAAVLVARDGAPAPDGVRAIASLDGLLKA